MASTLTPSRVDRLAQDTADFFAITAKSFEAMGRKLAVIREREDWRAEYGDFGKYCKTRLEVTQRQAERLISGAAVVKELRDAAARSQKPPILPPTEFHARPLTKLRDGKALDMELVDGAWQYTLETTGVLKGKPMPSAARVEECIDTYLEDLAEANAEPIDDQDDEAEGGEELDDNEEEATDACEDDEDDNPEEEEDAVPAYAGEPISIDRWKEMPASQKRQAVGFRAKTSFNEQKSKSIEWALWSWNPVTGCNHGCDYCYARDIMEDRFPDIGFTPTFHPKRLGAPQNMKVPDGASDNIGLKNVFTCSVADLFGAWVPKAWIDAVLQVVGEAPDWNFLFLTKNPRRLLQCEFPQNAWIGTTVDRQAKVRTAQEVFGKLSPVTVRFVSIEPLWEPIKFTSLKMFDWMIVGGASASKQTPQWQPPRDWSEALRQQAKKYNCEFFEKDNLLQRIREYPGKKLS